VDGISSVTVVSSGDDGVEEGGKELVRFFITSNGTDGLDHWVTLVINTSLDAVGKLDSESSGLVLVLIPELGVLFQSVGKKRVVLRQIGKISGRVISREGGPSLSADVLGSATAGLDPLRKSLDASRKTVWWVAIKSSDGVLRLDLVGHDEGASRSGRAGSNTTDLGSDDHFFKK
jgi:hypothetical protein